MKRSTISPYNSPPSLPTLDQQSAGTSADQSRVDCVTRTLNSDFGRNIPYPPSGRVRDFLLEKTYVHDPRDEPAIIDWCVQTGAAFLLCHLIGEWRRQDLCLQGGADHKLLTSAISHALKAAAVNLVIANWASDPRDGSGDSDDDDGCDRLVMFLTRAACQCEALSLKHFSLLSSSDLCSFLALSSERASLSRLSLCDVAGMDDATLVALGSLLSTSKKLEHLELGGLPPCSMSGTCSALATALSASVVRTLSLQGCDARFLIDFLTALNELPDGTHIPLTQLDISCAIPGDAGGQASGDGQRQRRDIERQLSLLSSRHERLASIDTQVQVVSADEPPAPALPQTLVDWSPRVVGSPRFVREISERLCWQVDNPIKGQAHRLLPLPGNATLRITFHLANGDPLKLKRLLKRLNRAHSELWDDVYARRLEARAGQDTRVVNTIKELLMKGKAIDLAAYAARLRSSGRLPSPEALDFIQSTHVKTAFDWSSWNWAFRPARAIENLVSSGHTSSIPAWFLALRNVGALPSSEELEPLINLYLDRGRSDVVEALYLFHT